MRQTPPVLPILLVAFLGIVDVHGARNGGALQDDVRAGLQTDDILRLRSVGDVHLSPDGSRVAYTVVRNDEPGHPYSQLLIADVATGAARPVGGASDTGSAPCWSPDGRQLAWIGRSGSASGLMVANGDGSAARLLAAISGTNHPLPSSGESFTWSPDGRSIAFVSSSPGPEADANGDPMVITRYLYKPTASEGTTRFNDNRRTHIYVADVASGKVRQLTHGTYYEHSIDWSPRGNEIVFVSNRGPDPDRFFNYDLFAVDVASGAVRRLTDTRSAEYYPQWSPDGEWLAFTGTTRPLTSSETTMEDTHVWRMRRDGTAREEVGESVDNRQGPPRWSRDGRWIYSALQERGQVRLIRFRASADAGKARHEAVVGERGSVSSWSSAGETLAYAFSAAESPADLYVRVGGAVRRLTRLNANLLEGRTAAAVEAFTFASFDGTPIEAFLTKPVGTRARAPLIVMIHGGPHGQQGPAFNQKAQIYAAQGWAVLMVNYRGSTGYGQKLADAIFRDQNGGEARDVLAGVDAALARYPWLDATRLGVEGSSYGGQLTNWLITQTDRFRAAIPTAGISNLVSFNYMAYYHDYLAVEFGAFPHEDGLMDLLWERSPIRYVHKARTPTLFLHGENDNDVPIAEAEQLFIALKDVGVETQMVRYPREGHGIRETKHVVDAIERSIAWYRRHFAGARPSDQR